MKCFVPNRFKLKLPGLYVLIVILSAFTRLTAQEFSVHQQLDTNQLRLGEQARLTIQLIHKPGYTVQMPSYRDSIPAAIEILSIHKLDSSLREGMIHRVYQLDLTCFDSGAYLIPSMTYIFKSGSSSDTLNTVPVGLVMLPVQVDSQKDLYDIKPPIGAPITWQEALLAGGAGLGGILILVLIIYLVRRFRRKKMGIIPSKPKDPPDVIALRELDELKEQKLWQQGKTKEYYTRLTGIVRAYIEERFLVPALEQTSTEILRSLKFTALEDESTFSALRQLLELADLVKFAKALPLPDENEGNLLNAYVFVNRTRIMHLSQNEPEIVSPENQAGK